MKHPIDFLASNLKKFKRLASAAGCCDDDDSAPRGLRDGAPDGRRARLGLARARARLICPDCQARGRPGSPRKRGAMLRRADETNKLERAAIAEEREAVDPPS